MLGVLVRPLRGVVFVATTAWLSAGAEARPEFHAMGLQPGWTASSAEGISADGLTAVGFGYSNGTLPIRWRSAEGLQVLDFAPGFGGTAKAASADGSVC